MNGTAAVRRRRSVLLVFLFFFSFHRRSLNFEVCRNFGCKIDCQCMCFVYRVYCMHVSVSYVYVHTRAKFPLNSTELMLDRAIRHFLRFDYSHRYVSFKTPQHRPTRNAYVLFQFFFLAISNSLCEMWIAQNIHNFPSNMLFL